MKEKLLTGILLAAVSGLLFGGVFFLGSSWGSNKVKLEWQAENQRRDRISSDLVIKNIKLEAENEKLSTEIEQKLSEAQKQYDTAIAGISADYAARLRSSESRARIYREQAKGEALEQQRLAEHAAELDRSLEEGRSLVRELRETLGLRDEQIRQLSQQIIADRALLN